MEETGLQGRTSELRARFLPRHFAGYYVWCVNLTVSCSHSGCTVVLAQSPSQDMKETDLGQHVWLAERSALSQWQLHLDAFLGSSPCNTLKTLHIKTKQTRTRSRTRAVHAGPAKAVAKEKKAETVQVLLRLQHLLFVWTKLSFPLQVLQKKKVPTLCSSSKMERNSEVLRVSFLLHRPSSQPFYQEKISRLGWKNRALWEKSVRVAAVRSSACSVCSRLLVSHCVCEKEGGKNSASRHTREKPAPWHSNQLTCFVIIIGPHKPKRGMLGSFSGCGATWLRPLVCFFFFILTVMMVMFQCRCLSLCPPPSFKFVFPQNIPLTCILSCIRISAVRERRKRNLQTSHQS